MQIKKLWLAVALGLPLISCSSSPKETGPDFQASRIIERMGGVKETPAWATGAKLMWKEQSDVIFAHMMTMSGNSRPEACMNAAALQGKAEMLQYIKSNITTSGQLMDASLTSDPAYESLTAFLSQGSLSGAAVRDRYWEKFVTSDESGERVLRLRCAAAITVRSNVLERQLSDAMNPAQQGHPEIRQKLLDAQKDFIDSL